MNVVTPTYYSPAFAESLSQYFLSHLAPYEAQEVVTEGKNWTRKESRRIPLELPTIEYWCVINKIHTQRVYEWAEIHPEWADALARARAWQKHLLIQGGLLGVYESKFAQFASINLTDMRNTIMMEGGITVQQLQSPEERGILSALAQEIGKRIAQGSLPKQITNDVT